MGRVKLISLAYPASYEAGKSEYILITYGPTTIRRAITKEQARRAFVILRRQHWHIYPLLSQRGIWQAARRPPYPNGAQNILIWRG